VALAASDGDVDGEAFFAALRRACVSAEFGERIEQAARVRTVGELAGLGNRIEALESVPTAIAAFALTPDSYAEAVGNVILLGGDTDTLAAMAGALSGGRLGVPGLPARLAGLVGASAR